MFLIAANLTILSILFMRGHSGRICVKKSVTCERNERWKKVYTQNQLVRYRAHEYLGLVGNCLVSR